MIPTPVIPAPVPHPRPPSLVATQQEEFRQLAGTRERLLRELGDRLPAPEIERRFFDAVAQFSDVKVRTFVPLLVAKLVRAEVGRPTDAAGAPADS